LPFGDDLGLYDRRQPSRKLDKLGRRPVRRRTGHRELLLGGLPRRPFAGKFGPLAGKFSRQPLDVGLQRGDVRFEWPGERWASASRARRRAPAPADRLLR
jgi:hypothetical protein